MQAFVDKTLACSTRKKNGQKQERNFAYRNNRRHDGNRGKIEFHGTKIRLSFDVCAKNFIQQRL